MKQKFYTTLAPWLIFAVGFLAPWLFLFYIPFAAALIYRMITDEYGEVYSYWKKRLQKAVSLSGAKSECRSLKAAAEMV